MIPTVKVEIFASMEIFTNFAQSENLAPPKKIIYVITMVI